MIKCYYKKLTLGYDFLYSVTNGIFPPLWNMCFGAAQTESQDPRHAHSA